MMQGSVPLSWKQEFAAAAAAKRADLLHKEKLASFEDRERQRRKEEQFDSEGHAAEIWAVMETILATPEAVAEFRVELDAYDAKTVEALMENREAIEAVRARLDAMLAEAHVLPDGRRVFKTKDGTRVFDEHGQELAPETIDPSEIDNRKPKWEAFKAEKEAEIRLQEERQQLIDYQTKLDEARARLDKGDITQDELEDIKAELSAGMPDAVRGKLGPEAPEREASPRPDGDAAPALNAADAATAASLPPDMDALMRQTGFGPSGPLPG